MHHDTQLTFHTSVSDEHKKSVLTSEAQEFWFIYTNFLIKEGYSYYKRESKGRRASIKESTQKLLQADPSSEVENGMQRIHLLI